MASKPLLGSVVTENRRSAGSPARLLGAKDMKSGDLFEPIILAALAVEQATDKALAPVGVSFQQYTCLELLDGSGPMVGHCLCRSLSCDDSACFDVIESLLEQGAVLPTEGCSLKPSPSATYYCSEFGLLLLHRGRPVLDEISKTMVRTVGAEQIDSFLSVLSEIQNLRSDAS